MSEINHIERFSVRKLTIGAVSVGIGLCAATLSSNTVKADTLDVNSQNEAQNVAAKNTEFKHINVQNQSEVQDNQASQNEDTQAISTQSQVFADAKNEVVKSDSVENKIDPNVDSKKDLKTAKTANKTQGKSLADTTQINLPKEKVLVNADPMPKYHDLSSGHSHAAINGLNSLKIANENLLSRAHSILITKRTAMLLLLRINPLKTSHLMIFWFKVL